jgi:hypothetical protein
VSEDPGRVQDLLAYPAEGRNLAVNPPGFCWTPKDKAAAYRLEVRAIDSARMALFTNPQTSTVFAPDRRLEPGHYQWQVIYLDASRVPFARSATRQFYIAEGVPDLPMPAVRQLKERLAGARPRLFLAGDRLAVLREAIARGSVPAWNRLKAAADGALSEPLYPEPAPPRPGIPEDQEWLRIFTPAKIGSAHLARLALAYRMEGRQKYLEGARRWMVHLASWDPRGITSHNLKLPNGDTGNDEASMPMLERISLAWDWMGEQLSAKEREIVLAAMRERGNQVLQLLRHDDFLSHPFNNHSGRVIAFLGDAGLAFLGDIPEAEEWLDYVIRCYLTSYPAWGGDAGGWSQGMSYWSFYVYGHVNFLEALRDATGVDVFRRPFYRNTGYLPVYFHPPYAPQGGFGDGSYHPPSEVSAVLTDSLSEIFRDPVLKWQAKCAALFGEKNTTRWREWFIEDVIETLQEGRSSRTGSHPPSDLERSRHFEDIGWVSMHSALGDADKDIWVSFKSSRYGSFSHSHADQNSYQLYAYGRALAIDSGYYPSYGTPHDNFWTRQTQAHNGILIEGRGQAAHSWEASGHVESYRQDGPVTLVRGQAAGAYNVPQPAILARDWEKYLRSPLPPMEPVLESFERTLAFVAPGNHPFLIVQDYLRAGAPARFDWLLHALNPMELDISSGSIFIRDGDARAYVRLAAKVPFQFEQKTGFPIQPEFAANTAYVLGKEAFKDQSHLKVSTSLPVREMKFLAIFVPYRSLEALPKVEAINSGEIFGYRVEDSEVLAWWGSGQRGPIVAGEFSGTVRLVIRIRENGNIRTIVSD